ncbi:hypothetical protein WA577_002664 [Blastocystis sp. JDR]
MCQDVKNALSFLNASKLCDTGIYDIFPNKEQNETALFLYIFYRIGIVCPELIRVSVELDEEASISFRDYEKQGIEIGKSFFTLFFLTIPSSLTKTVSRCELHKQACSMVNYLHSISISATAFLEIVNVLLSAVAMFTKVNPNSDGVKTMLTIYSNLYEVYYELHLDMDPIPAITLTQSMIANDQPFLEWIPAMMSTGYYVTDQLIQYLLLNINALNHILAGNQLQLNLCDVILSAMDYATLGLRREEAIFAHTTYAFRDKHLQQHHELLQKLQALQGQVEAVETRVVARRALNVLNEWLTVHVLVTDKAMVRACVEKECLFLPEWKEHKSATAYSLEESPVALYRRKYGEES